MESASSFEVVPEAPVPEAEVDGKLGRLLEGQTHSFPGNASVTQYFQSSFLANRINPGSIALYDEERTTTFLELDQLSTKLAQALKAELGHAYSNRNPDGDLVFGVCAPPSDRLVVLLFAIMKLGGAYVPFDISFPEERVIHIVSVAKPLLVISDAHETTLLKFEPVKEETNVLTLDYVWELMGKMESSEEGSGKVAPLDGPPNLWERTAIVLFTSGSSGEPKGVRLNHRTILNRLNWQWHRFPFIPEESCCFKTALTFVDSVPEIFGPLLQGRHVVVIPKTVVSQPHLFVQKVRDHKITRLTLVPSLLASLLTLMEIAEVRGAPQQMLASIKLWICSGETLTHELLTQFFKAFPSGTTICNFYGSTEVMGDVTYEAFETPEDVDIKCLGEKGAHVPLGSALYNSVIYILGPNMELKPEGQVGEIYVAGYNLAKGYVGVRDSDKFIFNPFTRTQGFSNLYRTGDFGHIASMANGRRALFYDGRIDSQIKVRGHRVDLSEIDAALNELTLVKKGIVLCYHAGQHDQQIVAFVVPHEDGTAERVNFLLEMKLLPYQLPKVKILNEIPVLVNGKTDRQRLLWEYHEELLNRSEFEDWEKLDIPKQELHSFKVLINTISRVTGTAVHDIVGNLEGSFYNIGGTSLNSLTVIAELKKQDHSITIHNFVTAKSIRELFSFMKPTEKINLYSGIGSDADKILTTEILTNSHKAEVIHIISASFAHKGDLESYLHVIYNDFVAMLESVWEKLVEKGFSFIVRRKTDSKLIAVSLNFDVYDEPEDILLSPGLETIIAFLESCEAPIREQLPQGKGKIMHSFMMGTHEDLTEAENVYVVQFMEEEIVRLAQSYKFVGLFTTNTNALTQQIATHIQGYEVLADIQVNQYEENGKKPFVFAPDTQRALVCWKNIEK